MTKTPYINVLTYPRISLRAAESRVKQLRSMGIDGLIFEGKTKIGRLGLLGIGTVGVVVRAKVGDNDAFAVKIRRMDANRPNMDEEFRMTTLVNRVGVGVPVMAHTKDMILMRLVVYQEAHEWFGSLKGEGTRRLARSMLHSIFNQCRKLDIMGVDHGQLSNLRKHIVIAEGRPWIIDFESAATSRRPKNVTAAAQYMLVGGRPAPMIRRLLGIKGTGRILDLLSEYKGDLSDYAYSRILEYLKLKLA